MVVVLQQVSLFAISLIYRHCGVIGKVFNNTDTNSVLILSDLINGTYNYTLVVTNSKGLKNNDTVTLHVKQGTLIIKQHIPTLYLSLSRSTFNVYHTSLY